MEKRHRVAFALALGLAGCTAQPGGVDLAAFTLADLRAAEALAVGDPLAAPCYAALERVVEAGGPLGGVVGAVSAFQAARNLRRGDAVKLACGGLLLDERQLAVRLAALAAGGL